MNKPTNKQMDNIEKINDQILELEKLINQKKATLEQAVKELFNHYQSEKEALEVMNFLYWYMPEIQSNHISKAIGLQSSSMLMEVLSDFESEIICDKCGKPVYFSSRQKLKEARTKLKKNQYLYKGEYSVLCGKCIKELYTK